MFQSFKTYRFKSQGKKLISYLKKKRKLKLKRRNLLKKNFEALASYLKRKVGADTYHT
jgi:hypothetical protein